MTKSLTKLRISIILTCCLLTFHMIGLAQGPTADFTANTTAGCGPLTVQFIDKSSGSPNSWTWDLGNGTISSAQNPAITYTTPGTYTITLIVKNANGANSIQKTDYISVYPYPGTNFITDLQTGCAPATINFTDKSTPGQGTLVAWKWDFGDGTTSSAQNPNHVFNQTGYYNISLTATNSAGCATTNVFNRYIRVVSGIQPDFTSATSSCNAPFTVNFTNQTSGPGTLTYQWDLATSTSTAKDPIATYPNSNTYTVKLTASSNFGCTASISKTVSFQGRQPVITAPDSACVNSSVSFSNGSSPLPAGSRWDFGDGTFSNAANPDKTYTSTGTYTVTLTNDYGNCTAPVTKSIKIVTTGASIFTADPIGACKAPFNVQFKDQTPGATSWSWNFGDGSTSTDQNPSHTYNAPGKFDVTLNAISASGCNGSSTQKEFIKILTPQAFIVPESVKGCVGSAVNPRFTFVLGDTIQSWQWSAPGAIPSSSTLPNPAFVYNTEGNYDLTVTMTTSTGCTLTKTLPAGVTIGDKIPPTFSATPQISCAHQPITFTSTLTGIDSWLWNFGDNVAIRSAPPVSHAYSDSGYFDVTLFIEHHGCVLNYKAINYIYIRPPIAKFDYQIDCADRHIVHFHDSAKYDHSQPPPSYRWEFGDGTTSTVSSPTHPYPSLGSFTVLQIVDNSANGGCIDTAKQTIELGTITASFAVNNHSNDSVCSKAPITLQSTSTPSTAVDSFKWQIGTTPYTVATADSNFYTTILPDTGAIDIALTVIDKGGCPWNTHRTIHATGPDAKFQSALGGCRNNPIAFTDQSKPYPGYPLSSWSFDFGDGKSQTYSNTSNITHAYTDTGSFTVKLTVTDLAGCADTFAVTSATHISSARAGFFAPDTLYCPNAALPFVDTSKGNITAYSWDFGDWSALDANHNPTHSYSTNGQLYSVKLKVTDASGCIDSLTRNNYIHIQSPIAAFDMQDSSGICFPLQTTFLPAGKYYDSLYWDFADGTTSTLDTTTHFFNTYGTFTVKLILQGAGGCRDTATRNVNVYQIVPSILSLGPIVKACDSVPAQFTLTPPPFTKFTLYFGDNAIDSSGNFTPQHTYHFPSSYFPALSIMDSSGCVQALNNGSITVLGAVPIMSADRKAACDSATIFFTGTVISNDRPFTASWDFGDGNSGPGRPDDISQDTTYRYSAPGINIAMLKINTASNCNATYPDTIHIYQTPHPTIALDGTQCTGLIQWKGDLVTPDIDPVIWAWSFSDGQQSSAQNPQLKFAPASLTARLVTSVSFGCSDTTTKTVEIYPLPEIKGPAEISTPVGIPVIIPFTYSHNVDSWSWTPPDNLDCTDCGNPKANPTFATSYTVTVTDSNTCSSQATILVKTVCNTENWFIPNTFSPNNDGVNDVFYPRGVGVSTVQSMRVFNRWGQMVFERKNFPANSAAMGWDGNFNGHPSPTDAYVYIIEVVCNNAQVIALKGDITLVR